MFYADYKQLKKEFETEGEQWLYFIATRAQIQRTCSRSSGKDESGAPADVSASAIVL